ncbi:MAG: hypothetical protein ABJC51_03410 [Acidobacteriota bacterium]
MWTAFNVALERNGLPRIIRLLKQQSLAADRQDVRRKAYVRMKTQLIDRALLVTSAIVALTTAVFPTVTGYGTHLLQIVEFTAWALLAGVTSGSFADQHHGILWVIVSGVNVFTFWIVAVPFWALMRRRSQSVGLSALLGVSAFYIASLFWLFPASDGP